MTLIRVAFELTNRCNLNCVHCMRERHPKPRDLEPELLDKILGQAGDYYGIQLAAFTGGEPLMHPRFERILEILVERDFFMSFVSNGHLVPKRLSLLTQPEVKKRLGNICLSLDGHEESVHDSIRGGGAFKKTLASMILLRNAGIPVVVNYTIGRHNHDRIEEALLAISHLKADRIEVAHTHPTPDNVEAGLVLDPSECRAAESTVYRLATELKVPITMTAGVYTPQRFYSCASLDMADFYVDVEGRLCVCCMLPGIRGRDPNEKERDIIADLREVDLWEAHGKLLSAVTALKRKRIEEIGKGGMAETDHFQCIACARFFGKLDWLDGLDENPWSSLKAPGGGSKK